MPTSLPDPRAAYDLTGRTAVVTGAASDLGAAVARTLAAVGARVVLGDIAGPRLDAVAKALREAGADVESRVTDVTSARSVEALVEAAGPHLDVMVNLAGIIADADVTETSEEELDRVLAVNTKGVFLGCRAAVVAMAPNRKGAIVNMASSGAYGALPGLAAYGMSKAAVVSLTRSLAAEVGQHGIRVNAVAPGYVEGGMSTRRARRPDGRVDETRMEEIRQEVRRRMPLLVLSEPEDVAHAVLYLATDASRTTTGQVLHPNAGRPMVS